MDWHSPFAAVAGSDWSGHAISPAVANFQHARFIPRVEADPGGRHTVSPQLTVSTHRAGDRLRLLYTS